MNLSKHEEAEGEYVPTIDFSGLYIYKKRVPRSRKELVSMNEMADSVRSEADVSHEMEMDSLVRRYVAPPERVHHFLESKKKITEKEAATMNQSVDTYLEQLKKVLPPIQHVSKHFVETNEVPIGFSVFTVPTKRSIAKIFERTKFYDSRSPKLTAKLPDIYITQQFKEFVRQSGEKMPQILIESNISPPSGTSSSPRRKRKNIHPNVPQCASSRK